MVNGEWNHVAGVAVACLQKGFVVIKKSHPDMCRKLGPQKERALPCCWSDFSPGGVEAPPPAYSPGAGTLILRVFEGELGAGEEPGTMQELGAQLCTLEEV